MIQYAEALRKIFETARGKCLGTETVSLGSAIGRVLFADILSPEEVPSFNNSSMDGFCVLSSETTGAISSEPLEIPVLGLVTAGGPVWEVNARVGDEPYCVEIMTGAPIPTAQFDSVIKIEDAQVVRNAEGTVKSIKIARPIPSGENIRLKGTDFHIGQRVLASGTQMAPHHILSCAALGISELKVRRKPRFAVVSTGSELISSERKDLPHGMIRNSTGPYLMAALTEMGAEVSSFGIVQDDPAEYLSLLRHICEDSYDGVVSTGAVSMGKFDFVSDVLKQLGADVHFHKVAIRPGKPILFAELKMGDKDVAFFGMPGNPVSTAVGCRFLLGPYLRAISGLNSEKPTTAILTGSVNKQAGLRCFYKGHAVLRAEGIQVEALKAQASYVVSALNVSNCWVVLPEAGSQVEEGALVEVYPLSQTSLGGFL